VENLKLYEPALVAEDISVMLPSMEDLAPKNMSILVEDADWKRRRGHLIVVTMRYGILD